MSTRRVRIGETEYIDYGLGWRALIEGVEGRRRPVWLTPGDAEYVEQRWRQGVDELTETPIDECVLRVWQQALERAPELEMQAFEVGVAREPGERRRALSTLFEMVLQSFSVWPGPLVPFGAICDAVETLGKQYAFLVFDLEELDACGWRT